MARVGNSKRLSLTTEEPVKPESSPITAPDAGLPPPSGPVNPPSVPKKIDASSYKRGGKAYATAMKVLLLKADHKTYKEIAEILGTSEGYIKNIMWMAGKNGWFTEGDFADPSEELAFKTVHKVVKNINQALDGQDLTDKQQEMTLETAKGIGLFKQHSSSKVDGTSLSPGLSITIQLPAGHEQPQLPEGGAVGAPMFLEAEKVDDAV